MGLEATIIIVDNSEHSRNGDYLPSRFEAQADAVNIIFSAKTQANPESSVGLMSMGGAQPEVLTTLTTDFGRIISGLSRTKIKGKSNFSTALNVGGLALKHRQNKAQRQRIILFTCSPISEEEGALAKLAKRLKKNSIAVDIIAFGELDTDNSRKVEVFHENVTTSGDSDHASNLVIIPPGPNLLSDSIVTTPICGGGEGGAGPEAMNTDGGQNFEYGVDPNTDPELALALRMSMEEEERRSQREQREKAEREGKTDLETVPESQEESKGEASGSKPNDDKKEGGGSSGDKMDTT